MFIITDKKHNTGLLLQEYNGKLGIVYCYQEEDKICPYWVFRQATWRKIPVAKSMPHRVELGAPKQAKVILEKFIAEIEKIYLSGDVPQTEEKPVPEEKPVVKKKPAAKKKAKP